MKCEASSRWRVSWLVMAGLVLSVAQGFAWADVAPAPVKSLSELGRAKVLAALAGLVILGIGMVLLTWLGARFTQRYRQGTPYLRPTPRPGEHDWAGKPLVPKEPDDGDRSVE
jgi:hypothetical protein